MKVCLIEEARDWWRFSSTWAAAWAIGVLTVWNMMPVAIRLVVPDWIEILVGALLWGFVMLCRLAAQPKAREKIEARKEARDGQ